MSETIISKIGFIPVSIARPSAQEDGFQLGCFTAGAPTVGPFSGLTLQEFMQIMWLVKTWTITLNFDVTWKWAVFNKNEDGDCEETEEETENSYSYEFDLTRTLPFSKEDVLCDAFGEAIGWTSDSGINWSFRAMTSGTEEAPVSTPNFYRQDSEFGIQFNLGYFINNDLIITPDSGFINDYEGVYAFFQLSDSSAPSGISGTSLSVNIQVGDNTYPTELVIGLDAFTYPESAVPKPESDPDCFETLFNSAETTINSVTMVASF